MNTKLETTILKTKKQIKNLKQEIINKGLEPKPITFKKSSTNEFENLSESTSLFLSCFGSFFYILEKYELFSDNNKKHLLKVWESIINDTIGMHFWNLDEFNEDIIDDEITMLHYQFQLQQEFIAKASFYVRSVLIRNIHNLMYDWEQIVCKLIEEAINWFSVDQINSFDTNEQCNEWYKSLIIIENYINEIHNLNKLSSKKHNWIKLTYNYIVNFYVNESEWTNKLHIESNLKFSDFNIELRSNYHNFEYFVQRQIYYFFNSSDGILFNHSFKLYLEKQIKFLKRS